MEDADLYGHFVLHLDRAAHSVDHAEKFAQAPVAEFGDAPSTRAAIVIDQIAV